MTAGRSTLTSGLFIQLPPEVWQRLAQSLLGTEWDDISAIIDLQAAFLLEGEDGIPSYRVAAERWGWGKDRAGALIAGRSRWLFPWIHQARKGRH